jgi:hypothetical protein
MIKPRLWIFSVNKRVFDGRLLAFPVQQFMASAAINFTKIPSNFTPTALHFAPFLG